MTTCLLEVTSPILEQFRAKNLELEIRLEEARLERLTLTLTLTLTLMGGSSGEAGGPESIGDYGSVSGFPDSGGRESGERGGGDHTPS